MGQKNHSATSTKSHPRIAQAALFALVGAGALALGFLADRVFASPYGDWVSALFFYDWFLLRGFLYTSFLGVTLWRARYLSDLGAVLFSCAAMFWDIVGMFMFWSVSQTFPAGNYLVGSRFWPWFWGAFAASAWIAFLGAPWLSVRLSLKLMAWILGCGVAFAVLVGLVGIAYYDFLVAHWEYPVIAWGVVQAVGLSMGLSARQSRTS